MEYWSSKRIELARSLEYTWLNSKGDDISDIIRGKIMMLDEILNIEAAFKNYDSLKKAVDEFGKGAN